MDYYYGDDRMCDCCLYNYHSLSSSSHCLNTDEIYYLSNYTNFSKFQIDFYNYVENFVSSQPSVFDDELLSINLIRSQTITFNEKRLSKLLQQIKEHEYLDYNLKLNLVQILLCWHSQFNNLNLIKKIVQFNQDYLKTDQKRIGNFHNTLLFSIHSHSLDIVKLMVEDYGTQLDMSVFKYAIIENQPEILDYLIKKLKSSLKLDLIEFLLDVAVKESKIECIKVLLEYSIKFKCEINQEKLMNCCEYLSLSLDSNILKNDLKYDLYQILFGIFKLDLSGRTRFGNETLFSVCFEFTEPKFYKLFFYYLNENKKVSGTIDEILIDALINKIKRSFESNLKLIEILLDSIQNKKKLYEKLVNFDNGILLGPSENQLKNIKLDPPFGLSVKIKNSYFIMHEMLVKYDVIPRDKIGTWLGNYIYYWTQRCSNNSGYVSATSILRYISSNEMIDLVENYLSFLIENGFVDIGRKTDLSWWFDLKEKQKMNELMNRDIMNQVECILISAYESNRKTPISLKMIARNKVRNSLVSLSNDSINQLKLPKLLVKYLRNV
ncbi:unnamed protein product [Brachionus calyciflorus]|uniref:SOCS box domain-containing protein n=1 Tax=Brachionus calyciflorus TaxID=104777 RepID=A0A814HSU0_9BILA|nr:unnamed protein product [Brachionus calyciflorus]